VPVFAFRHYWQDRGRFPAGSAHDMEVSVPVRSRWLNFAPYGALVAAALTVAVSHWLAASV
jgi:hypothetical protein